MLDNTQILASLAQPGDLFAGKYRVESVIAVGGMGVVLAARNEDLDQPVVLKLLRPDVGENDEALFRFLREARTSAKLQSEHVVRVYDVGTTDSGIAYIVMERLTGKDLHDLVDASGPLPIRDAVDFVMEALEALAEAHAAGVVHRDIKPSNIFCAQRTDGSHCIKVLDFGISKPHGLDAPSAGGVYTGTEQVIGSPGFMSPEQMVRPRDVDGRSDIWSIGVVLYMLATGEQPFEGETVAHSMANILTQDAPRVRSKRPDAPAALQRVLDGCLERAPADRFTDVAQLARALAPLGSSWAKLSVERIEKALSAAGPAGQTLLRLAAQRPADTGPPSAWVRVAKRGARQRILLYGALAALAGLGGGALWSWLGRSAPPATGATAAAGDTRPPVTLAPPIAGTGEPSGASTASATAASSTAAPSSARETPAASSAPAPPSVGAGTRPAGPLPSQKPKAANPDSLFGRH